MKLHFLLTEEDGDIIFWKESLPHFYFSEYVKDILVAEKRKKYAFLPVPQEQGFTKKRVDTKLYLHGKDVIEIVQKLPKGRRARIIKKIIRKHLRMNYRKAGAIVPSEEEKEEIKINAQPAEEEKTTTDVNDAVNYEDEDEMSDEYRQMLNQMSRRKFS